jgi:hypothetical protein
VGFSAGSAAAARVWVQMEKLGHYATIFLYFSSDLEWGKGTLVPPLPWPSAGRSFTTHALHLDHGANAVSA